MRLDSRFLIKALIATINVASCNGFGAAGILFRIHAVFVETANVYDRR
jgi:hypothetical protein